MRNYIYLCALFYLFSLCHKEACADVWLRPWGEPSCGLRCSLSVHGAAWSRSEPATVSIIAENVSAGKIKLVTIPAFSLDNMGYWCPVDIAVTDQALAANCRTTIELSPGESIRSTIDLSKMGWDSSCSSIWPAKDLYTLVPPGRHKLRLSIEVMGNESPRWIHSNIVEITIR